jgi:hypothetical protein
MWDFCPFWRGSGPPVDPLVRLIECTRLLEWVRFNRVHMVIRVYTFIRVTVKYDIFYNVE